MDDPLSLSDIERSPPNTSTESEKRINIDVSMPIHNQCQPLVTELCSTPATSEISEPNSRLVRKLVTRTPPNPKKKELLPKKKPSVTYQGLVKNKAPEPSKTPFPNNKPIITYQGRVKNNSTTNPGLSGLTPGANSYTLKIHQLQMRIEQLLGCTGESIKQLALLLYLRFPQEYSILHTLLNTPPKHELKDVFNDSCISCNTPLFKHYLTEKTRSMSGEEKQCFISIGECNIKPRFYYDIKKDNLLGIHDDADDLKPQPATTVVVMILQGIFVKWKQPIATIYLANDIPSSIKKWAKKSIKSIADIGFDVHAVVCNTDFRYLSKDTLHTQKKKFYFLSDLSSLFINFYYNFTKCNYKFHDSIAKFQDIRDYVQMDSNREVPITPKLTENLLSPESIEEIDIEFVMEVFSLTTAAAISSYIDFDLIDTSAKPTVVLIKKMNKLYNILSVDSCDNVTMKGLEGETSQLEFLAEMFLFFDQLNLHKPKRNLAFNIEASHKRGVALFKSNINDVLSMSEHFKTENSKNVPFGRFSNNAIKLFFNQVRNHSKSITKPTAKEVDSIFRQTAIINLLKVSSTRRKKSIMEGVLDEYTKIINKLKYVPDKPQTSSYRISKKYKVHTSEYATLDVGMGRKDGIILIAGFLLKKCADFHKCSCIDFNAYIDKTANELETISMCQSIINEVRNGVCLLPSVSFVEFVESLEIIFRTFMNKDIILRSDNNALLSCLLKSTETKNDSIVMPCKCFPTIYAKKLFLRFRIYHTLKYNNELHRTKLNTRIIVNKI